MNPYEILGVAKNANDADIKRAYHKLVMKYHPDKNSGDKAAEEKFKEVNNAFDILKDPQKRAAYDRFGDAAFAGGNGASAGAGAGGFGNGFGGFEFNMGGGMEDLLREAMKGFGFGNMGGMGNPEPAVHQGRDLLHSVDITLKEAFFGTTKTVKFATHVKCEKCRGHGTKDGRAASVCKNCRGAGTVNSRRGMFWTEEQCPECNGLGRDIKDKCRDCDATGIVWKNRTIDVVIPAGVADGARLRLRGMGEAAPFDGPSGDFYIDVHVMPDSRFTRRGNDLIMRVNVDFATLALGGKIEVITIDDKKIDVKIDAGTQIGEKLRVRGYGMPGGDLFVEIGIVIPKKLSSKQKRALEEFMKS